jgi:hypothetical protein
VSVPLFLDVLTGSRDVPFGEGGVVVEREAVNPNIKPSQQTAEQAIEIEWSIEVKWRGVGVNCSTLIDKRSEPSRFLITIPTRANTTFVSLRLPIFLLIFSFSLALLSITDQFRCLSCCSIFSTMPLVHLPEGEEVIEPEHTRVPVRISIRSL